MDPTDFANFTYLVANILQIPCAIFLLILLPPLYKICRERIALYILFSKTFLSICNQLSLAIYFLLFLENSYASTIYPYISDALNFAYYSHIVLLALNRFTAIFALMHYKQIWSKKNVAIIILCTWLFGFSIGIFYTWYVECVNWLSFLHYFVMIVSSVCYISMVLKMAYGIVRKWVRQNGTGPAGHQMGNSVTTLAVEKDRLLTFLLCFLSLLPMFLVKIVAYAKNIVPPYSIGALVFSVCTALTITATQCVEELCLLAFCKDFRIQLREQFRCCCGPIYGRCKSSGQNSIPISKAIVVVPTS